MGSPTRTVKSTPPRVKADLGHPMYGSSALRKANPSCSTWMHAHRRGRHMKVVGTFSAYPARQCLVGGTQGVLCGMVDDGTFEQHVTTHFDWKPNQLKESFNIRSITWVSKAS